MKYWFLAFTVSLFSFFSVTSQSKIDGLTMVAPPEEFEVNPIPKIVEAKADWVAFVPYAFTRSGNPNVSYNNEWQWWGETYVGVKKCINLAHEKDLKVMLKPQVYIPGGWVGEMDFKKEKDWLTWEKDYRAYIMLFVDLAIEEKVEMFCVGTEYKIAIRKREKFWRQLISDIRSKYSGSLVYSANWDSYEAVPFWDVLDQIGVSAYFPLTDKATPSVRELLKLWKPTVKKLKQFSRKHKKKILFTEYGYLSVDKCAHKAWLIEKERSDLPINEQAQANALEALYTTFWFEDFWAGGFLWKWFPNMRGHEGYPAKDYTPQGKISLEVLSKWYNRS